MAERGKAWIGFLIGLAAIVAGFWKTFIGDPLSNDRWHTLHGIVSLLWVVLLITQSLLIRGGRHGLHRQLGWASLALVVLLLGSSSYMVYVETVGDPDFPRDLRLTLIFLDVVFLLLFAVIYGLGLAFRRRRRLHARLMGSTILIGLGPALGRFYAEYVPAAHGLAGGLRWTMWTIEAVLVVAILLELRQGRPLWPLPAMLGVFVALQVGMGWATGDSFAAIARAAGAPV
ncbi:hypothetical protein HZF05_15135 [Sphingomonas sp. CGMCC 1.13654]|uniref:DUF2306 domain-containing protein n=1 Tax=Sphingomonas chungangi TaxID=2683589 RepID=A0A838LA14_9SPHN|nr:hypothetical protein [Sphingomonas chungangi]MBA2935419.1 hypothetical protein [Sphingomonas chungangi]MVW56926.1 hypothetical protein [Sphingomonas chungangi]